MRARANIFSLSPSEPKRTTHKKVPRIDLRNRIAAPGEPTMWTQKNDATDLL